MGPSRSSASHPKVPCFATFEMRRWSKKINTKLQKSSQTISLVLDVPTYKKTKKKMVPPHQKSQKVLVKNQKIMSFSRKNLKNFKATGIIIQPPMTYRPMGPMGPHPTCTTLNRSQLQPPGKCNMPLVPLTSCGNAKLPTQVFGGNSTPEKKTNAPQEMHHKTRF